MKNLPESHPNFKVVGESAVLVDLAEIMDLSVNQRVHALDVWMGKSTLEGVREWVPGYSSLLIIFNPLQTDCTSVQSWLMERWHSCPDVSELSHNQVIIPVCYGGEEGPDLEYVAKAHRFSLSEVVRLHTAPVYRVGMMGFTPGFAYLMGLNSKLATPRLTNPRTKIPAGSVGIAGRQTGIYPLESPGGWQLIGRTDVVLFDPNQEPHFLLSPGDVVRFVVADGSAVR